MTRAGRTPEGRKLGEITQAKAGIVPKSLRR